MKHIIALALATLLSACGGGETEYGECRGDAEYGTHASWFVGPLQIAPVQSGPETLYICPKGAPG